MKKRYLYVLLFAVPALLASIIISLLLFGAAAGILWIFVFGDNPWPSSADNILTAMLILACMTLWVFFMSAAYVAGKKQEEHTALNVKHVLASAGATALLVLLAGLHQWGVGNIGPKSDDVLCSDFCRDKGFAGSGMPPRDAGAATCSCFDAQGREAVKVPMREVIQSPFRD
jgi:hypothetical protein